MPDGVHLSRVLHVGATAKRSGRAGFTAVRFGSVLFGLTVTTSHRRAGIHFPHYAGGDSEGA